MREYSKVSPQFWIGKTGKEMRERGVQTQLLAQYLISSPNSNMIGVYYLPIPIIAYETGMSVVDVSNALQNLINIQFCSYDADKDYIWVHNMGFFQLDKSLDPKDKRVIYANNQFKGLPLLSFLSEFFKKYYQAFHLDARKDVECVIDAPLMPLRSQEQEQNQEQDHKQKREIVSANEQEYSKRSFSSFKNDNKNYYEKYKNDAIELINLLNEKTKKNYAPTPSNLRCIYERLTEGETLDTCRAIIAKKNNDWKGCAKMEPSLDPVVLFKKDNFDRYKGSLVQVEEDLINANL